MLDLEFGFPGLYISMTDESGRNYRIEIPLKCSNIISGAELFSQLLYIIIIQFILFKNNFLCTLMIAIIWRTHEVKLYPDFRLLHPRKAMWLSLICSTFLGRELQSVEIFSWQCYTSCLSLVASMHGKAPLCHKEQIFPGIKIVLRYRDQSET